jgi:hypothetical protein
MTCQSRIPPLQLPKVQPNANGYPSAVIQRCGQSVGVSYFLDAAGQRRDYCSLPDHHEDVLAQALHDDRLRSGLRESASRPELLERARHDLEEDARA